MTDGHSGDTVSQTGTDGRADAHDDGGKSAVATDRRVPSMDKPGAAARCRFYPSCSEYALTAIATHGPVRGLGLAIWRLLRCHPFHPGGIDHVPPPRTRRTATT